MRRILSYLFFGLLAADATAASASVDRQRLETEYTVKAIASILVAEAGCDKQPGLLAVAEVIRNRAREKHKTPIAIIKQPGAFSSLLDTDLDALISKQRNHPQFPTALKIARSLLRRPASLPDTTHRATHFDHINNAPYWVQFARATATIGSHRFYRTAY